MGHSFPLLVGVDAQTCNCGRLAADADCGRVACLAPQSAGFALPGSGVPAQSQASSLSFPLLFYAALSAYTYRSEGTKANAIFDPIAAIFRWAPYRCSLLPGRYIAALRMERVAQNRASAPSTAKMAKACATATSCRWPPISARA